MPLTFLRPPASSLVRPSPLLRNRNIPLRINLQPSPPSSSSHSCVLIPISTYPKKIVIKREKWPKNIFYFSYPLVCRTYTIYFFDTIEKTELDCEERRERPYRIPGTALLRFRLKVVRGRCRGMRWPLFYSLRLVRYLTA